MSFPFGPKHYFWSHLSDCVFCGYDTALFVGQHKPVYLQKPRKALSAASALSRSTRLAVKIHNSHHIIFGELCSNHSRPLHARLCLLRKSYVLVCMARVFECSDREQFHPTIDYSSHDARSVHSINLWPTESREKAQRHRLVHGIQH
jgi:hypothetical protein